MSFDKPQRMRDLKNKCENLDIMLAVNSKKFNLQFDSDSFELSSTKRDIHDVEHEILDIRQQYEKLIIQLKIDFQKKAEALQQE